MVEDRYFRYDAHFLRWIPALPSPSELELLKNAPGKK